MKIKYAENLIGENFLAQKFPNLWHACICDVSPQKVLLVHPSSAASERVFPLLNNSFSQLQDSEWTSQLYCNIFNVAV